ncbi:MAG TPA: DUF6151 family protein [Kofleriaceae bacterium]|nr:DUF6151 family protein [Kofleriaceae bacterium]
MNPTVDVRCRCGAVEGRIENAGRDTVNRVVCYCDDCQAFAHHLGRADLLDAHGGSDVVQVAPAALAYTRGADRIAGVRLRPKGLYRWYASCCNTPLGNTLGPAVPFVGIVAQAFGSPDESFGPPIGGILGKFAIGEPPPGSTRPNLRLLGRAVRKVLGWKLGGHTWPHPFFDRATRAPRYPITVLSHDEREALRPLCGPKPA